MTQLRIMDALTLQRERQREKNRDTNSQLSRGEKRTPVNKGCVSKIMLAKALYPNQTGQTLSSTGQWLTISKNKMKTIDPNKLQIICYLLGVDSSFIHGFESIHDKDFNRLVKIDK